MSTFRETALRGVVLKALYDAIKDEAEAGRTEILEGVLGLYESVGAKSLDVSLPSGVKVASITLTIPKDKAEITNVEAYRAYVAEVYPHVPIIVPATATIPSAFTEAWLGKLEFDADGNALDPETGELVGFAALKPASSPSSFSIRYAPQGREAIARAWQAGELGNLEGAMSPPALEGGGAE